MKYLLRDALMGPLASVAVLLNALVQMLTASLPVLAFVRFGDAKTAGWLFAAFGLGGLIGTLIAYQLVKRMEPLVLASLAALGFALPLWALVTTHRSASILASIVLTAVCGPLINAPMFGLITTRTPEALLPKVMTAIITLATLAGPLGLVLAGFLLQHEGLTVTYTIIAAGVTFTCLLLVALLMRFRRREAGEAAAVAG